MSLIIAILFFLTPSAPQHQINIQIDNMRNTKGNFQLTVFLDQASFASEQPSVVKVFSKEDAVSDGVFTCSIQLPAGEYGISILDDEDGDGRMKYNMIGMPKEGYGFSNFIHTGFSRPTFSDFKFSLNEDVEDMKIRMRYL